MDKDQMVVKEFLQGLGSSFEARDPVEYLKNIQRMKGEWFNQQGRTSEHADMIGLDLGLDDYYVVHRNWIWFAGFNAEKTGDPFTVP